MTQRLKENVIACWNLSGGVRLSCRLQKIDQKLPDARANKPFLGRSCVGPVSFSFFFLFFDLGKELFPGDPHFLYYFKTAVEIKMWILILEQTCIHLAFTTKKKKKATLLSFVSVSVWRNN